MTVSSLAEAPGWIVSPGGRGVPADVVLKILVGLEDTEGAWNFGANVIAAEASVAEADLREASLSIRLSSFFFVKRKR